MCQAPLIEQLGPSSLFSLEELIVHWRKQIATQRHHTRAITVTCAEWCIVREHFLWIGCDLYLLGLVSEREDAVWGCENTGWLGKSLGLLARHNYRRSETSWDVTKGMKVVSKSNPIWPHCHSLSFFSQYYQSQGLKHARQMLHQRATSLASLPTTNSPFCYTRPHFQFLLSL